jgi:hypothetical protein
MIQWDEQYQCMCDCMGLPISITEAEEIMAQLKKHIKKGAPALLKVHKELIARHHPTWGDEFSRSVGSLK